VLGGEREKNPPKLLAAQMVDARVPGKAEEPRFELGWSLKAVDGADHLNEDKLREVVNGVAPAGHGVNEAGNTTLVADDEIPLGVLLAALGTAHKLHQRGR
jgi:hypothetical protein